jgi:hypothetical protein
MCEKSSIPNERQSAPTGAQEPEKQEGADRPLGGAACSPSGHSETKMSTPQPPASLAEADTQEPFARGFQAMAEELLDDKWGLAVLINKSTRPDLRRLLVELILWQELGRPDRAKLREQFSDDETQARVQELLASPWSEILSLVGLTLCEDGYVIVSGEQILFVGPAGVYIGPVTTGSKMAEVVDLTRIFFGFGSVYPRRVQAFF